MINHLSSSVIEHIYEVMELPLQETSTDRSNEYSISRPGFLCYFDIAHFFDCLISVRTEIKEETFEVKHEMFKPDHLGELLISLSREVDKVAEDSLKLVNAQLDKLNQKGVNLLNQIPIFLNNIEDFCKAHNLSDINSVKNAHSLPSDAFNVYYRILKSLFQKIKEQNPSLDKSVKITNLLDEASRYIFREECTLLPFLVEKLTDYKQELQQSLGKLKETINDSGACKRALNMAYQEHFESCVDSIKRELRATMEEFKFASDMLQRVHAQIYHAFSTTPAGKEYFRTLNDDGQPGDEYAKSSVRSCFESVADSDGVAHSVQPFFDYVIKERLLEYYQVHHTFQGFEYRPLFDLNEDQQEVLKQRIFATFRETMIKLCGDDSQSKWMIHEVVSHLLAGNGITAKQSADFWRTVFQPGKCRICISVQGIQVNIRPLLVLAGYLTSDAVQLLSCRQSEIRDELSCHELFQCRKADKGKYYEAICQGHKGKSVPIEVEQVMNSIFKVRRIA